jgi:thiamine kinase-like enzyme
VKEQELKAIEALLSQLKGEPIEIKSVQLKSTTRQVYVHVIKDQHGDAYCVKAMSPSRSDYNSSKRLATVTTSHKMMADGKCYPRSLGVIAIHNGKPVTLPIMDVHTKVIQVIEFASARARDSLAYKLRRCTKNGIDEYDRNTIRQITDLLVELHGRPIELGDPRKRIARYKESLDDVTSHALRLLSNFAANDPVLPLVVQHELLMHAVQFTQGWRQRWKRIRALHGDFNPGNIFLGKKKAFTLDLSRIRLGEPAIDVAWLTAEFMWLFQLAKARKVECVPMYFKEMAELFLDEYCRKTGDTKIREALCLTFVLKVAIKLWMKDSQVPLEVQKAYLNQILASIRKKELVWM